MANKLCVFYKGHEITTRSTELKSYPTQARRFYASYSVTFADRHRSSWQQFCDDGFESSAGATANAVMVAQGAIDGLAR